jgi:hypothetical protein
MFQPCLDRYVDEFERENHLQDDVHHLNGEERLHDGQFHVGGLPRVASARPYSGAAGETAGHGLLMPACHRKFAGTGKVRLN